MTTRTLFSIILKILGILYIKDILLTLPQLISFFVFTLSSAYEGGKFGTLVFFLLCTGTYLLVAYYLLFKTDWLIVKLKLAEGFDVDPIRFTMHRSTVLSICVIVIGAMMFVNAVPLFIKNAITYYKEANFSQFSDSAYSPDNTYLIMYGLQIIIGLLLMGNQRQIVNFIEHRRMKTYEEETPE